MALNRKICIRETCDGFDVIDTTGAYDAEDNPGGYGPENGILGPYEFSPDTAEVYRPKQDFPGTPFATLTLATLTEPNEGDNYVWSFTKEGLGLKAIESGVWTFAVFGEFDGSQYGQYIGPVFTRDVWERLKPKVDAFDPSCPCNGCTNPNDLFIQLQTVRCSGICDVKKAQRIIDWIYSQLKTCC